MSITSNVAIPAVMAIATAVAISITVFRSNLSKIEKAIDDKAITFIMVIGAIVAIRVIMVITDITAILAIIAVIVMTTIINKLGLS